MTASAGNIANTAFGSSLETSVVAKATAGAVSLPTGSPMTFSGSKSGQISIITERCCSPAITKIFFGSIIPFRRLMVCVSIGSSPTIGKNCLGKALRLSGQNRSPLPPAIITTNRLFMYLN